MSLQRSLGSPPVKGPTEEAHQQDKPVSNTRDADSCDSSDDWPDEKFNALVRKLPVKVFESSVKRKCCEPTRDESKVIHDVEIEPGAKIGEVFRDWRDKQNSLFF